MIKYSWLCPKCGGAVMWDDKKVVQDVRKKHKKQGCVFLKGKDNVLRRPGLV